MALNIVRLAILGVLFSPEDPQAWKRKVGREYQFARKLAKMTPEVREAYIKHQNRTRITPRESIRRQKIKSPERFKRRAFKWNHSEKCKQSKYRHRRSPRGVATRRAYEQRKWLDPQYRIRKLLRGRISMAIRAAGTYKNAPTAELLACTIPQLQAHLQSKFQSGMTWENYGPVWHVDHIKPCVKFDLTQDAEQRKCFHWSNLQPLFALENHRKGGR